MVSALFSTSPLLKRQIRRSMACCPSSYLGCATVVSRGRTLAARGYIIIAHHGNILGHLQIGLFDGREGP